jgi:hypothetical protein
MMTNMNFDSQYMRKGGKRLRHPHNKRFVTARVNMTNNKKVIHISIGLDVCSVVEFEKGDRVNVFIHKKDRNLLIIKKEAEYDVNGYVLSANGHQNSSFLTFEFRYETSEDFRLSQTIILDYDFSQVGMLLIDIEKIKWRK